MLRAQFDSESPARAETRTLPYRPKQLGQLEEVHYSLLHVPLQRCLALRNSSGNKRLCHRLCVSNVCAQYTTSAILILRRVINVRMGASSASAGAVCAVWQTLLLIAAFLSSVQAADRAIATGSTTCPGLQLDPVSGIVECTAECQQRTCAALATFFIFSYSPSNPALRSWRNRQGWETTLTQSCDDILALPGYGGMPSYCGWYGITCCTSAPAFFNPFALVNYPACSVLKSVTEINLQVNGLKASIADIAFQQSIAQLHACGVMRLVLPGNSLSGSLTDFWGDLSNLTALNLGEYLSHECQIVQQQLLAMPIIDKTCSTASVQSST